MKCSAVYMGRPMLGAETGRTYTVEIGSGACDVTPRYLWVRLPEVPEYLIPYENMLCLMTDWRFIGGEDEAYARHREIVDAWLDIYKPEEAVEKEDAEEAMES